MSMSSITAKTTAQANWTLAQATRVGGLMLILGYPGLVLGAQTDPARPLTGQGPRILVETETSTWVTRGRNVFDFEATVRVKLAAAGLTVVRAAGEPHEYTLTGEYREERGPELTITSYGTEIHCHIEVRSDDQDPVLELTIQAESGSGENGVPPYLDALHNFQTDPYFYLLGDLVAGRILSGQDPGVSLVDGLKRLTAASTGKPDRHSANHSMPSSEVVYGEGARLNVIAELGRLQEPRAVPVLLNLLGHQDERVRVASIRALGALKAGEARSALERAATEDPHARVRKAALAVLEILPGVTRSP